MNSFNLTLSGKHFICPPILNSSFAGYSNLGCRSLSFMTLNTSFQPLLACNVSVEKSAESQAYFNIPVGHFMYSLKKIYSIPLPILNLIFFLLLSCISFLYVLDIKTLSHTKFASIFSHSVDCLFSLLVISFAGLGKFSIIFSNKF